MISQVAYRQVLINADFGVPTILPPVDNGLPPTDLHECNGSPVSQTPSVAAALDHDPNAERRKRRRTDTNSAAADDIITTPNNVHNSAETEVAAPPVQTQGNCISVQVLAPSEQGQHQQPLASNTNPTPSESNQKKQKVIKLNANGRLLSSPVADRFTDKSKMKGNKRGKTGPKNTENPKSKLVVIKYINKEGVSESLGQQISEIINGQRKHVASSRAPPPANSVSKPTPKQPAKPTHPFFMKKPLHKTDISSEQLPCQNPITTPSEDGSTSITERPPSRPMSKPLLSFKHAFSKVPEPMHPLWPPLGLTHVRELSGELDSQDDGTSFETDRRKSKSPAVQVNDEDSVLSSMIHSTRVVDPVLRHPSKHIISGPALQAEIAKRLTTQHDASNPNMVPSHGPSHPAITKLYASLPTATAAFDRGDYETRAWAQKYAPTSAQQVLCATKEALMLRDWLKHLIVLSVETSNSSKGNEKAKRKEENKRKRRKKSDKLEGFIVSSDDEASEMGEISGSDDELAGDVTVSSKRTVIRTGDLTFNLRSNERGRMTNAILLSGPPGCGKTASVYAVAKEMDFEVFEINAGHRRSAKDILDRIGDMTQNHLVHNVHGNGSPMGSQASTTDPDAGGLEDGKQNKLMGFFKPNSTTATSKSSKAQAPAKEVDMKQSRNQKQSLILLEEADILFEEDKQFWSGVLTLINQSKRPIIITCNDENLVPLDDISFHAILRYKAPSLELAVDYLLLVAANEGHILKRTVVEKLYLSTGNDLRRSVTELNYWCQMAVGSEKSGIDWIIDRWPQGRDLDSNGDKLRVLSENTYDDCMGWFSRDVLTGTGLTTETELRQEALHWWQLSLQEADSMEDIQHQPLLETSPNASKLELLESLRFQSDYMESRSVLDLFAATSSLDTGMVSSTSIFLSLYEINSHRTQLTHLYFQYRKSRGSIMPKATDYYKPIKSPIIQR